MAPVEAAAVDFPAAPGAEGFPGAASVVLAAAAADFPAVPAGEDSPVAEAFPAVEVAPAAGALAGAESIHMEKSSVSDFGCGAFLSCKGGKRGHTGPLWNI